MPRQRYKKDSLKPHDRKAYQLPTHIDIRNADLETIGYLVSITDLPFSVQGKRRKRKERKSKEMKRRE